jgi:NAD-dependent dihydropyrimidine dehydrogenase PreA subunit/DNA-binding HxlR family transcriptional regulator
MLEDLDKLWYRVARTIAKAGKMPIPISTRVIELLKTIMTEKQAKFILHFKSPTLNIDQIKERTHLDDNILNEILNDLMNQGIIVGVPSRTTGLMVYRLLPMWPGLFEYQFLRGTTTDHDKKKAHLFEKIFEELREGTQKNYDTIIDQFKKLPALDRVIPVEEQIDVGAEGIMPYEEIRRIISDYDNIAISNCYCRTEKELVNDPCKLNAPKYNCFFFDKSALFVVKHNFGKKISKKDALKVFREAEDYGLVHKVFHVHLDTTNNIEAICNCCKCCCGPFQMYYQGIMPIHTITSYIARINMEGCIGCGTCVSKCPMETIELEDGIAIVDDAKCIGCGICAHHCPENAIKLERVGPREVFVPPKKQSNS